MPDTRLRYVRLTKSVDSMTKCEVEDAFEDTDTILEQLENRWKELELIDSNIYV